MFKRISILILIFLISACNLGETPHQSDGSTIPVATNISSGQEAEAVSTATEEQPTATDIPLPEHRIGVRVVDGVGEFYNKDTGEKFVPRGFNYLHMATQEMAWGETRYQDATFSTDVYDPVAAAEALRGMHDLGYNTVRVFLTDSVTGFVGFGQDFQRRPGY